MSTFEGLSGHFRDRIASVGVEGREPIDGFGGVVGERALVHFFHDFLDG